MEKVTNLNEYRERQTERQAERENRERASKVSLFLARAAYWELRREDLWKALEVAERERENALREVGMLNGTWEERGCEEEESGERMVREDDRERANVIQLELDYGAALRNRGIQSSLERSDTPEDLPPA